jgi:hypothetical protein
LEGLIWKKSAFNKINKMIGKAIKVKGKLDFFISSDNLYSDESSSSEQKSS